MVSITDSLCIYLRLALVKGEHLFFFIKGKETIFLFNPNTVILTRLSTVTKLLSWPFGATANLFSIIHHAFIPLPKEFYVSITSSHHSLQSITIWKLCYLYLKDPSPVKTVICYYVRIYSSSVFRMSLTYLCWSPCLSPILLLDLDQSLNLSKSCNFKLYLCFSHLQYQVILAFVQ